MSAVRTSPELVALGKDGRGEDRFTSREMIETEQRLERAGDRLADRGRHGLPATSLQNGGRDAAGSDGLMLGDQQRDALAHITGKNDLAIVVGYAGTGKSTMLGVARDEWERSEEHTSELQSLMRISYAVFCLNKNTQHIRNTQMHRPQNN